MWYPSNSGLSASAQMLQPSIQLVKKLIGASIVSKNDRVLGLNVRESIFASKKRVVLLAYH